MGYYEFPSNHCANFLQSEFAAENDECAFSTNVWTSDYCELLSEVLHAAAIEADELSAQNLHNMCLDYQRQHVLYPQKQQPNRPLDDIWDQTCPTPTITTINHGCPTPYAQPGFQAPTYGDSLRESQQLSKTRNDITGILQSLHSIRFEIQK